LNRLKKIEGPKLLHVITTKGKGLSKAEKDQITYHAPGPFDKLSGELIDQNDNDFPPKYQDVFGSTLVELAEKNKKIVGITPAMPTGSSLKYMIERFPERAFDVGIAEQHAVTLAAGLATQGMLPYCVIYSTFLQRAYDQIIHDVALQNLPVVFCIDRAGLVGEDGPTHHGAFDLAYLSCIPNVVICCPMDEMELRNIMYSAQFDLKGPLAIRYPRGRGIHSDWKKPFKMIETGKGRMIKNGSQLAVLSVGPIGETIIGICKKEKYKEIAHYDMRFVKPLDENLLDEIFSKFTKVITIEEGVVSGGFGMSVLAFKNQGKYADVEVECLGLPDRFIEHGSMSKLYEIVGLDQNSIEMAIDRNLNCKNC
jgi:1-deoxy-D-xylulose-5-phosphate synthase